MKTITLESVKAEQFLSAEVIKTLHNAVESRKIVTKKN